MTFSDNLALSLQRACDELDLTQEQLAALCSLSSRHISSLICRRASPTIETLEKICSALRKTPDELLLSPDWRAAPLPLVPLKVVERQTHGNRSMESYPICPNCRTALDREYQAYCDRCGQPLLWDDDAEVLI